MFASTATVSDPARAGNAGYRADLATSSSARWLAGRRFDRDLEIALHHMIA
jgi:hypothetical protein